MVLASDIAEKALGLGLCYHCLGRLFAALGHGLSNEERGMIVEIWASGEKRSMIEDHEPTPAPTSTNPEKCYLCSGLFLYLDDFSSLVVERVSNLEFDTILIGSRVDNEILRREEEILTITGTEYAESIKSELNREIGKRVCSYLKKEADFRHPDLQVTVDTRYMETEIQINPLYIYGRYRKLVRGIPQTRWVCRYCKGVGCSYCDHKGKLYPTSVEEIIGEPMLKKTGGKTTKFHGAGREDIDAKMLGSGRPYVIEILEPKKRRIDLEAIASEINSSGSVEVIDLRLSNREEVRRIKVKGSAKRYRAKVRSSALHDGAERKVKEALAFLIENPIYQRTPQRVAHRRSDMVRERRVLDCSLLKLEGDECEIEIMGESGLYIKELISGDGGRTRPSLSNILGADCEVLELDVMEVGDG